MKHFLLVILFCVISSLHSQSILGKWKTIDDETGKEKSIVYIFENNGKIYGKIIEVINPKQENPKCTKCHGVNKDQPIFGMQIINGLSKKGDVYEGETNLNPTNGKIYKCKLSLGENSNQLQVRGYIAFFYKTQYWQRID